VLLLIYVKPSEVVGNQKRSVSILHCTCQRGRMNVPPEPFACDHCTEQTVRWTFPFFFEMSLGLNMGFFFAVRCKSCRCNKMVNTTWEHCYLEENVLPHPTFPFPHFHLSSSFPSSHSPINLSLPFSNALFHVLSYFSPLCAARSAPT